MKINITYLLVLSLMTIAPAFPGDVTKQYSLIPKPVSLQPREGFCILDANTKVLISSEGRETQELGLFIADLLSASLGTPIPVQEGDVFTEKGSLTIIIDEHHPVILSEHRESKNGPFEDSAEGYSLAVTPDAITIKARTNQGAFWGLQTLRQLMPAEVERHMQMAGTAIMVPCVVIEDAPCFSHRGLLLDVSRHMFPVAFIKKYIDMLSLYKLNTFHWHLTDDQGWRIEIKKYPKLQEVGAYRDETLLGHKHKNKPWQFDGKRYGGYYTQEQIKEVIEYAQKRYVTIIPEIDLPGHCLSALAAYPELGCLADSYKVATSWGICNEVYCVGNEKTFEFLENVLDEVMDLFPCNYIHIGGDEVRKQRWQECSKCQACMKRNGLRNEHELQSYVIRRIEAFVHNKGKQIIGWDEILEGGLAPRAVVMSWRGITGGIEAARLGHDVIMTPHQELYFDFYQSQSPYEPVAIGGYVPLEKVYKYEPIPDSLADDERKHILGVQANVWTEYISTPEQVEYMTYPRAIALAEIAWTQSSLKNYDSFVDRLSLNLRRLRAMNVHFFVE